MLISSKNFKWHEDEILTCNIKEIKLKLQEELSNNLSNHRGSNLTLPQKSKCYFLVSEYSMLN